MDAGFFLNSEIDTHRDSKNTALQSTGFPGKMGAD
jgi:hypothetical protein